MESTNKEIGKWGETEAIRLMKNAGIHVVEANWSFLHLEIDVVGMDGETLVITEVKTRSSAQFGEPETFVTKAKQKKLIRAANWYMEHKHLRCEVRFDVAGILIRGNKVETRYIRDAFSPVG